MYRKPKIRDATLARLYVFNFIYLYEFNARAEQGPEGSSVSSGLFSSASQRDSRTVCIRESAQLGRSRGAQRLENEGNEAQGQPAAANPPSLLPVASILLLNLGISFVFNLHFYVVQAYQKVYYRT